MTVKRCNKTSILQEAVEAVTLFRGDWAEFGVASGRSAEMLIALAAGRLPEVTIHLLDCFRGLPEAWHRGPDMVTAAGAWSRQGLPPKGLMDHKCTNVVVGLFEDTVGAWAEDLTEPLALMHIDSDLYSSCRSILELAGHRIAPGTVILFDEFHGFPYADRHEAKAWQEFVDDHNVKTTILATGQQQLLLVVDEIDNTG